MHERVQTPFPPLIQRCGAGGGERRTEDGVKKAREIYRTSRAQVITDRCRQKHEQRESRFYELGEV
jgi:hypothetical protein